MTRATLVIVGVLSLATTAASQTTPRDPANPHPTAGFLGADTCIACHDEEEKSYLDSPHGKASNPRAPAALHQCETCHGPGEKHIDDPTVNTSIRKFTKMAPRQVNAVCLGERRKLILDLTSDVKHFTTRYE